MRIIRLLSILYVLTVLISIYWAWQVNLNISDWLAMLGIWIFGAVLMFELFDFILKGHERKLKHSKDLIKEVLEQAVSETGHVDYNNDEIAPFYVKWAESSHMFPYALQHLKNRRYDKTRQAYERGKQYAKSIIDGIVKKIQQYREIVEQRLMQAKIPVPASDEIINYQTKHYNQKLVKHLIFKDTKRMLKERKKDRELRIYVSNPPVLPYLNWGASTVAVAEEGSLKSLQQTIENLENDETIVAIIKDINSLEIGLEANKELEQFNRGREEIVRQVRHGQKPLSGKCNLCP